MKRGRPADGNLFVTPWQYREGCLPANLDNSSQTKIWLSENLRTNPPLEALARMKRTCIVKNDLYLQHVMDPGHPESPERLKAIYRMLEEPEMKALLQRGEASARHA